MRNLIVCSSRLDPSAPTLTASGVRVQPEELV